MATNLEVTHKEEYSNGKKTRDEVVISLTSSYTGGGYKFGSQLGLISLKRDEVPNLIEQLQAITPTMTGKQTEV